MDLAISSANMTDATEEDPSHGGRFHTVQPLRDLQSNWGVDLAKNLEDYLLKICSGEISGNDESHLSVNFAEAALLLQGSIQVYSRKVEYLYNLVLHALEFVSHKSQQDQQERESVQPEEGSSGAVHDEDNDLFWCSDDVPVDAKNLLDNDGITGSLSHFVKPPANLVVLEGDCLDTTADGGELETYLLATNDLYHDFILLDPCDAVAVHDFLKENINGKGHNSAYRVGTVNSKARKSFHSPLRRSRGSNKKSAQKENPEINFNGSPLVCRNLEVNDLNMVHEFDMDDGFSDHMGLHDSDDSGDEDNDPWKPLNPHEPGNLKLKPFKKVKAFRRRVPNSSKRIPVSIQFPPAKMHGTVSPELMDIWEKQQQDCERERESQSTPPYEKLRESLINGGHDTSCNPEADNEDDGYDSDDPDTADVPNMMDEDVPLYDDKQDKDTGQFDNNDAFEHEDPQSHASLEDLCRSHLDALLASISEAEKQTELAARVSTWKQRIEHHLDEQDSRPPFDIHYYGDKILDTLSLKAQNDNVTSFADVVAGQEKHEVARSFSALLQLVNNGDVDLERNKDDSISCYTAVNPFYVRVLRHEKRHEELQIRPTKKRLKSPTKRVPAKCNVEKARTEKPSSTTDLLLAEPTASTIKLPSNKHTPEGKRRRRSRLVKPLSLSSSRLHSYLIRELHSYPIREMHSSPIRELHSSPIRELH